MKTFTVIWVLWCTCGGQAIFTDDRRYPMSLEQSGLWYMTKADCDENVKHPPAPDGGGEFWCEPKFHAARQAEWPTH